MLLLFPQGTLPCMTREGKIILETGSKVAMAPDGNGGIYPALQRKGALADMRRRGVEHVHVFSIDNALVRVADPHFLGYCIEKEADCGNKSVWKADPGEKVRACLCCACNRNYTVVYMCVLFCGTCNRNYRRMSRSMYLYGSRKHTPVIKQTHILTPAMKHFGFKHKC